MLEIVPMEAAHAAKLERQDAQAATLGLRVEMTQAYGQDIVDTPGEAWAALERSGDGERVVALFGLMETFRARQAYAWSAFSGDIGAHHLALTRFARDRIVDSIYFRIELITECADAEPLIAQRLDLDGAQLLAALTVPALRTPGMRWAMAIGMAPAHVLRNYGAASETHLLFERIGGHA